MIKLATIVICTILFISMFAPCLNQSDENYKTNYKNTQIENRVITQPIIETKSNSHIVMKATAYTRSHSEGTSRGITRSGTRVSRGTVAVDSRIIPLGTKLYIEGYGHAIALDTGGAIKGNRIDLYMETKKEAFEFGRQSVKVWIIEE